MKAADTFDAIEREQVGADLAESAFAMKGDWQGRPFVPPAAEQPGMYAWGEAWLLWAYLLQYEATRHVRCLDTFLARYARILALRDDVTGRRDAVRGRIMAAWGSVFFTGARYTCCFVHAGMLIYPAAHFLFLVHRDPRLRTRYADPAARLTRAVDETVSAFEDEWRVGPAGDEGYYLEVAEDRPLTPLNRQNTLGRALLQMAVVTGRADYREKAERLAAFFKRRLALRPDDAYQWAYSPPLHPPFDAGQGEDLSHASLNVDFAVLCRQHGVVFDARDMARFTNTFLHGVYRGDDRFADHVDGSGDTGRFADVIGLWGNLAEADPQVAEVIHAHFTRRRPPMTGPIALLTLGMLGRFGY